MKLEKMYKFSFRVNQSTMGKSKSSKIKDKFMFGVM